MSGKYVANIFMGGIIMATKKVKAEQQSVTLRVSAKSNPNAVAGAVAGSVRDYGAVELQAVGAGAVNQAIKAVAIARGYVAPDGRNLICTPAFVAVDIAGDQKTGIKLIVTPQR